MSAVPGSVRRRILLLTPRWPYPVIGGDRLRIWRLARAVAEHHDITLLSLCASQGELDAPAPEDGVFTSVHRILLPRWRSWWQALAAVPGRSPMQVAYYRSQAFQQEVDRLIGSHDMVWCHLARTAPYARHAALPRWLEMTDAVSLTMQRASETSPSPFSLRAAVLRMEAARMRIFEREQAAHFDLLSLVSEVDRDFLFCDHAPVRSHVVVAGNGVELAPGALPAMVDRPRGVAFIGQMHSMANRDAVAYLIREVWPEVRRRIPDARLHLIGPIAASDAARWGRVAGVVVEGVVPELALTLAGCRVGVCPVRLGAGVQNKLLDYMAHGLAAITSPIGLEGLGAQSGQDLRVAHSAADWIDQVCELLTDADIAQTLGTAGRTLVEGRYRWQQALAPVLQALDHLGEARSQRTPERPA